MSGKGLATQRSAHPFDETVSRLRPAIAAKG
jgi:hypothetical protein